MPRKLLLEALLKAAATDDPQCADYLNDELKLLEPSEQLVKAIIEHDVGRLLIPNDSGSTPMHAACSNIENIPDELLLYLLGKSPEALAVANKYGLLPVHKAVAAFATKKSLPNIRAVIASHKEGLLARSKDGQLPLHTALHSPKLYSVYLVELLLEFAPSAARMADKYGQYPLHKAALKPKIDPGVITVLLDAASDIAALKDLNGSLPLHLVLSKDNPNLEVVYLLVGAYPEGLFDPDYEDHLPYDKLLQRSSHGFSELSPEILALMEFTRQQINSRKPKPPSVPGPNLRN